MRAPRTIFLCVISLLAVLATAFPGQTAVIERFSPQGTAKEVRQVTVSFSEPMVSFGDQGEKEVFAANCGVKGKGSWIDTRQWTYIFEKTLPGGLACTFELDRALRTLAGNEITGQTRFAFDTGGPSVVSIHPDEGDESIDEQQVFILSLDAKPEEESVRANASCSVEGINERIGVALVSGNTRERLLKALGYKNEPAILVLQCARSFPAGAKVKLVWGKGIRSDGGVRTAADKVFAFTSRIPLTATFRCPRDNPGAECNPLLAMGLHFSAPVRTDAAAKIVLKGPKGKVHRAAPSKWEEGGDNVGNLTFKGPFVESSSYVLEMPAQIRDDAGRELTNKTMFPMTVRTDRYPPLAKFPARFGIIELREGALLPVTVRQLGGEQVDGSGIRADLRGMAYEVPGAKDEAVITWLRKVASAGRTRSVLKGQKDVKGFALPRAAGIDSTEVVGIPLRGQGVHVVEMESLVLGTQLLGEKKPLYVPTIALVTNLSAHFKWGRESSIVWVTTLDRAEPVAGAAVTVRDCRGRPLWEGTTDRDGIAYVPKALPGNPSLPTCSLKPDEDIHYDYSQLGALSEIHGGLFVFVRTADDMTFVHSAWDKGIEPWRFGLPAPSYLGPVTAHTVFDRTLVRAGDTVHMRHFIRATTGSGFGLLPGVELPGDLIMHHMGSDTRFTIPLAWDSSGSAASDWKIPADAKLGVYEVSLAWRDPKSPAQGEVRYTQQIPSGSVRVEEFRVPFMRGVIIPSDKPVINETETEVDISVAYLSGGGAGNAPVTLRSQPQPRQVYFSEYEGFLFSNGEVKEGIDRKKPHIADYEADDEGFPQDRRKQAVKSSSLTLDASGAARARITGIPKLSAPQQILAEVEFRDPNGETQTVSTRIPVWPSAHLIGIKTDSWVAVKGPFSPRVVVLDLKGTPLKGRPVDIEVFTKKHYTHRKRLIGGFYSYEHVTEIRKTSRSCSGITDDKGMVICEITVPSSGNMVVQATTLDAAGNPSVAHRDVWVAGKDEWWFEAGDSDRIDVIPDKRRYEPGERAVFQVRAPFREFTALITVEREGIAERRVMRLSGKNPTFELPIMDSHAPNIFVSVLCVRGRTGQEKPTPFVDLGRPGYRLGIAEIQVGWRAYELNVGVTTDKETYKVREKVRTVVRVRRSDGSAPPRGATAVIAAVDEALLELMPNKSWQILQAMMARRGYGVKTATAQLQVVGKRHFGLKAIPQGGGGGGRVTRELFDTLLYWQASVPIDEKGEASVEIPLNDSVTGFRIVAVAQGGTSLFGTGEKTIRTTQDLTVLAGVPPVVREGDRFKAGFTVRNASGIPLNVVLSAAVTPGLNEVSDTSRSKKSGQPMPLDPVPLRLSPAESREVFWDYVVPEGVSSLAWELSARDEAAGDLDRSRVVQKVIPAHPLRVVQSAIMPVSRSAVVPVQTPENAVKGKGGIAVTLSARLAQGMKGPSEYMRAYPYTCLEQRLSRAVALGDISLWQQIMQELPSSLDGDGLAKYFPGMREGSDVLTAYLLSLSHEAGYLIPKQTREQMEEGLTRFAEGRLSRRAPLSSADLTIRKMAAVEALSRTGKANARMLDSIAVEPHLWPASTLIDLVNVLARTPSIPQRQERLRAAEEALRSRILFQGSVMVFARETGDRLGGLMLSPDANAARAILSFIERDSGGDETPKLVRGLLARQKGGAWDTTVANAWGVLAVAKFSKKYEGSPVSGVTAVSFGGPAREVKWDDAPAGGAIAFGWPKERQDLRVEHGGAGSPWMLLRATAALVTKEPPSQGITVRKTVTPLEQARRGAWSRGDIVKVTIEMDAAADMPWVAVSDPVPGGATILGSGLKRDSALRGQDAKPHQGGWPVFTERAFDSFRAYYDHLPRGRTFVEYVLRLNNAGTFQVPGTRAEMLYAPEVFGETSRRTFDIGL